MPAVTHDIIATKLGINRTTVTKALKNDETIKEKTRKKVLETARLLGYDFKQSQQNRREGKRFFVREKVEFTFLDKKHVSETVHGTGTLTSLSMTGLLLKIEKTENNMIPLRPYYVKITSGETIQNITEVPIGKVIRVNFQGNTECAAKFEDGETLSIEYLESIEKQSFAEVDAKEQV